MFTIEPFSQRPSPRVHKSLRRCVCHGAILSQDEERRTKGGGEKRKGKRTLTTQQKFQGRRTAAMSIVSTSAPKRSTAVALFRSNSRTIDAPASRRLSPFPWHTRAVVAVLMANAFVPVHQPLRSPIQPPTPCSRCPRTFPFPRIPVPRRVPVQHPSQHPLLSLPR